MLTNLWITFCVISSVHNIVDNLIHTVDRNVYKRKGGYRVNNFIIFHIEYGVYPHVIHSIVLIT